MGRRHGDGHDRLIDAAKQTLASLTLDDLAPSLGIRRIARRAGVAANTATHHFGSGRGLAMAVLVDQLGEEAPINRETAEKLRRADEALTAGLADAMDRVADAARQNLKGLIEDSTGSAALQFALLCAPNEPEVRDMLHDMYAELRVSFAQVYADFAAATGRRFDPRGPLTAEALATSITAMVDGYTILSTFSPENVDLDAFAEAAVHLFYGATVPHDEADQPKVSERLIEAALALSRFGPAQMTDRSREAMHRAVADCYRSGGFERLTVIDVAKISQQMPSTVQEEFGTRDRMAAALFVSLCSQAVAAVVGEEDQRSPDMVDRVLVAVARCAIEHPELAVSAATVDLSGGDLPDLRSDGGEPFVFSAVSDLVGPSEPDRVRAIVFATVAAALRSRETDPERVVAAHRDLLAP